MNDFVKYFFEVSQNDIREVGRKGVHLAALTTAGFSVPPWFCITTHAYQEFIRSFGLEENIASTIAELDLSVLENVQTYGVALRQLIMEHEIPDSIKAAILPTYWKLFTLPPVLSFKEDRETSAHSVV